MAKIKIRLIAFVLACSIGASVGQLRQAAKSHGKYIGTAVNTADLTSHADISQIAAREFDCFTPENAMKWDATESSRGKFNFHDDDILVSHAAGKTIRGPTQHKVWHSQLPAWVTNGHFSAADLRSIMENRIKNVAGHYQGKLYAWDVVNEIFNEDGSLRHSVFYNTLGKGFVADAFKEAHTADPNAKLYINDNNVEGINAKSTGMYNLVKELLAQHVPIHGVGFQTHLASGQMHHDLQQNIERFAALELDVALKWTSRYGNPDSGKLQQQAKDYESVVKACLVVSRCVGITVWGVSDKYSWIHNGAPLLYDNNAKPKPAYTAVKNVRLKALLVRNKIQKESS